MRYIKRICFLIGLVFLFSSFQGWADDNTVSDRMNSMIAPWFIEVQKRPLSKEEIAKMQEADPHYIDTIVSNLGKNIDGLGSPNFDNAETLARLAQSDIKFSREQIDLIVAGLNHPDPLVVWQVEGALKHIFGICFRDEVGGVYKMHVIRKPLIEVWEKFWKQNRIQYGENLPLIINGLSLDAQYINHNSIKYLKLTFNNHGENDLILYSEVSGRINNNVSTPYMFSEDWPLSLLIGDKIIHPLIPMVYHPSCRVLTSTERNAIPDRAVHLEKITIPAGKTYMYLMNIADAFPDLNLSRNTTILIVRYGYGLYFTHKNEGVWRGELRSLPIVIKE
ncbi:MAG: hypothetical protein ACE14V_07685 [bacterium]